MEKTKILVSNLLLKVILTKKMALFVTLMMVVTFVPVIKQQMITGPIVNAGLFAAVILLDWRAGVLIGFLPSLFAVGFGFHPPIIFPLIPFIITSNIILVLVFSFLRKINYWLGIISASLFKFLFLSITSSFIISLFIKGPMGAKIAYMMSWPQLFTAICGGILAYLFLAVEMKAAKRTCPEGDTLSR